MRKNESGVAAEDKRSGPSTLPILSGTREIGTAYLGYC